jgi:hypothetical protein
VGAAYHLHIFSYVTFSASAFNSPASAVESSAKPLIAEEVVVGLVAFCDYSSWQAF